MFPEGASGSCPIFTGSFKETAATQVFLVAEKENINLSSGTITIDLTPQFPGLSEHIGVKKGIAVNCQGATSSFAKRLGPGGVVQGAQFRIQGQIHFTSQSVSGSNFRLNY